MECEKIYRAVPWAFSLCLPVATLMLPGQARLDPTSCLSWLTTWGFPTLVSTAARSRPPEEERSDVYNMNSVQIWSSGTNRAVPFSQVTSTVQTVSDDNIIRRLEEPTGLEIRASGFPAEILDDEPEEPGYEVVPRR